MDLQQWVEQMHKVPSNPSNFVFNSSLKFFLKMIISQDRKKTSPWTTETKIIQRLPKSC